MKDVIIVGAGGHGRGVLEILRAREAIGGTDVRGFLDDSPERAGSEVAGVPVLGTIEQAGEWTDCHFIIGVGDPEPRRRIAERLASHSVEYATAVHPKAVLYSDVEVGPGSVIAAGVVIAASTRLGAHTLVNLGATVGHDNQLAGFATVGPGANLGGFVRMEEASFIGLGGVVVPGKTLGAESKLGPGSVLLEDLDAGATAFGVPARVVDRKRRDS